MTVAFSAQEEQARQQAAMAGRVQELEASLREARQRSRQEVEEALAAAAQRETEAQVQPRRGPLSRAD
jgi:hypothetical protein|eukprot:COSAG01_NODE_16420_length_1237_cov_1.995606_1_plen_68_part_00